jgi:hypothetical protein
MSGVRVLVGTRKGAFVLTADAKRKTWDVSGPHFTDWEMYHLKGVTGRPESTVGPAKASTMTMRELVFVMMGSHAWM